MSLLHISNSCRNPLNVTLRLYTFDRFRCLLVCACVTIEISMLHECFVLVSLETVKVLAILMEKK